jgi:hypothetical protein
MDRLSSLAEWQQFVELKCFLESSYGRSLDIECNQMVVGDVVEFGIKLISDCLKDKDKVTLQQKEI